MKKLVLAAAIAAIAGNAMAAEVYKTDTTTVSVFGEIRTRLQTIENDDTGSKFDMGSSKLGVKASYAINDDLTAGGYLRYSFDLNDGDSEVKVSKGNVYLSSEKMGKVTIGKQGSVYDTFIGSYDASTLYGGEAKMASNEAGTDSIESAITYTWSNDSFTVMAQHSMADENNYELSGDFSSTDSIKEVQTVGPDLNADKDNNPNTGVAPVVTTTFETVTTKAALKGDLDKTYALGASWTSDFGLTLGGAYTLANLDGLTGLNATDESKYVDIETVGLEAGYSIGAWTLGASMTQIDTDSSKNKELQTESNSFGLGVAYAFDNGINAFAGYDIVNAEDTSKGVDKASNENDTTFYNVGVDYRPHPQVKTFVEYAHSKKDFEESGKKSESAGKWGMGVRVYF